MKLSVLVLSGVVLIACVLHDTHAAPQDVPQDDPTGATSQAVKRVVRQMPPGMPDMESMKDKMPAPPMGGRKRREAKGVGSMPTKKG